jgi:hypothetical protein
MKEAVQKAVDELVEGLPNATVTAKDDGSGGAYVLIEDVDLGPAFEPRSSWIIFQITYVYPDSDVYPHFINPEICYVERGPVPNQHVDGNLPLAMTRGATAPGFERAAIQVSRRSNRRNALTDSALGKLLRVLEFTRSR